MLSTSIVLIASGSIPLTNKSHIGRTKYFKAFFFHLGVALDLSKGLYVLSMSHDELYIFSMLDLAWEQLNYIKNLPIFRNFLPSCSAIVGVSPSYIASTLNTRYKTFWAN